MKMMEYCIGARLRDNECQILYRKRFVLPLRQEVVAGLERRMRGKRVSIVLLKKGGS